MTTTQTQAPLSPRNFGLADIQVGDQIRLRFTGSAPVPNRLGGTWHSVWESPRNRHGRLMTRVAVDVEGAVRRIRLEHIDAVERKGVLIAERRAVPTALVGHVTDQKPLRALNAV